MDSSWRFVDRNARFSALQAAGKHPRTEYDIYDGRFDERDSRTWREPDPPGALPDLRRNTRGYGSGLAGLDFGRPSGLSGPGMGMGMLASGSFGGLGGSGLDEPERSALAPLPSGVETGIGRPGSFGLNGGKIDYIGRQDTPVRRGSSLLPIDATPTVFVEGIPFDCTRREVAHIFRHFIGFKEVRLVHKEPKQRGGPKLLLCFVEFADARCATTALEALQGYKFDENDRESGSLRLQFARHGPRGGGR